MKAVNGTEGTLKRVSSKKPEVSFLKIYLVWDNPSETTNFLLETGKNNNLLQYSHRSF